MSTIPLAAGAQTSWVGWIPGPSRVVIAAISVLSNCTGGEHIAPVQYGDRLSGARAHSEQTACCYNNARSVVFADLLEMKLRISVLLSAFATNFARS